MEIINMFTKYPKIFIEVGRRMKSNWYYKKKDRDGIVDQAIFETLDLLEKEKLLNNNK